MTVRLSRFGTLVVCGALLAACSQLIGLNDYDEEGTAGESGEGSGAKGGAAAQSGMAGSTAAAGTGGSGGAALGGRGGTSSGGRPGGSGKGGGAGKGGSDIGGETSGGAPDVGGSSGASVGGEGGAPSYDCVSTVEITDLVLLPRDPYAGIYPANNSFGVLSPQIGDFAEDELWVDFYSSARYNGEATGTFDLGAPPDNNYATCARCVWLAQDLGQVSDPVAYFYVKSGTMIVDPASKQMDGFPLLSLDKVTLIESTIDVEDTHVSRPVENPRCLYLEHAEINMEPPPEEWTCYPEYYGQSDGCDCGCGVIDPDCYGNIYAGACEACGSEGACQTDTTYCEGIDPENNAECDTLPGWQCLTISYGDGTCDCGCGALDVDCTSIDPAVCVTCGDPYSCTPTSACTEIDPTDNTKCVVP